MTTKINGFNLDVTDAAGVARVRVYLASGAVVVDTDLVSIEGLGRMSEVFAKAQGMAYRLAEVRAAEYYAAEHRDRMNREVPA